MKKRLLKFVPLTLLFSLLFSVNVLAAGFTQDAAGIHYQKDDGTNVTSAWVEVANLWFLFDANGVCVNPAGALAPNDADGYYQIMTSYTPFVTTDTALLNQCLTNGTVVQVEGQYFSHLKLQPLCAMRILPLPITQSSRILPHLKLQPIYPMRILLLPTTPDTILIHTTTQNNSRLPPVMF